MTSVLPRTDLALVADLGGTHLRTGVARAGAVQTASVAPWRTAGSLESALRAACPPGLRRACLAVAAPVAGDVVRLTNAEVAFSTAALREALGVDELHVVNDLAALARSTTALRPADALHLGGRPLDHRRTVVVVAPGTGLGAAALVPTGGVPVVVSGEAGHVPLPVTGRALDVARVVLERHGYVSAEDLVSGSGLPLLDVAVRLLAGERDPAPRSARTVTAENGAALEVFVELLAALTQTYVLTLGAMGGVILGGGVLGGLVPALRRAGFAERVATHPRMARYLADLPVVVDRRPTPGLDGAALLLEDLA